MINEDNMAIDILYMYLRGNVIPCTYKIISRN